MSQLSDLCKHISAQEQAISQASSGLESSSTWCACWGGFRDSLWGKAIESFQGVKRVKRDKSHPVGGVALPDKHVVAALPETLLKSLAPKSKWILVRSEYSEAEQAAVLSGKTGFGAFVVSGQHGIGKSIFLLWLLMRRLALKLPTALQICNSYAVLFHEGGISEFTHTDYHPDYDPLMRLSKHPSRRIWVLVDSGPDLLKPFDIFKLSSPFFVVDVVPHRFNHLSWLNKIGHEYFYMKPWSDSEILQARPFLGRNHTEHQLWYLHKEFGASPGDLVNYARTPDVYKNFLTQGIANARDDSFFFRYFITVEPSQARRGRFEEKFVSRPVFDILWDVSLKDRTDKMAHLYVTFQVSPSMAIAAGWIFESWIHQFLTRQKTIRLFPVLGRRMGRNLTYDDYTASRRQENSMSLQLAGSGQHLLPEGGALEEGRYYRPESASFPEIDALLLVHPPYYPLPILFMFRIIRNQGEHGVSTDSLRKVDGLEFPSNALRCYVVVTQGDIRPEITVPMEYFEDKKQWLLHDTFPVFHYPVRWLFED